MKNKLIEICVNSAESAIAAEAGGADRIELCENLVEGGTTPSIGMIEICASKIQIPIHVLIRPRPGDFCYSELEMEIMVKDIEYIKKINGVKGFVIGALLPNGELDTKNMRRLTNACKPYSITFHRAFDVCANPELVLGQLIELGCDRLLSSGLENTAENGLSLLEKLHVISAGRIIIMPGSGINENNILKFKNIGLNEFHMSLKKHKNSIMEFRTSRVKMSSISGDDDCGYSICDEEKLQKVRALLDNEN
jgi:copper homeostasis protein